MWVGNDSLCNSCQAYLFRDCDDKPEKYYACYLQSFGWHWDHIVELYLWKHGCWTDVLAKVPSANCGIRQVFRLESVYPATKSALRTVLPVCDIFLVDLLLVSLFDDQDVNKLRRVAETVIRRDDKGHAYPWYCVLHHCSYYNACFHYRFFWTWLHDSQSFADFLLRLVYWERNIH